MDPKVTRSTFTGNFLCALGSNPAVAVFPKVCSGSKGDAKHFYWCFFCVRWARILLLFRFFRMRFSMASFRSDAGCVLVSMGSHVAGV